MNEAMPVVMNGTLPPNKHGLAWPDACRADQLAVRLLANSDYREHYSFGSVRNLLAEYGRRGNPKNNIAALQRLSGAGTSYRRYFRLGNEWAFRGAAPTSGHIAWHHIEDPSVLILDRIATYGVGSMPPLNDVPVVPGAQLRVCDLTNAHESRRYTATRTLDGLAWVEDGPWNPRPSRLMPSPTGQAELLAVSA